MIKYDTLRMFKLPMGTTRDLMMRLCLPYGQWICADGSKVIFNRQQQAIWKVSAEGVFSSAYPGEWIAAVGSEVFFNDGNPPWRSKKTLEKCFLMLAERMHTPSK